VSRTEPVPLTDVRCALGEGPTWDPTTGLVRWVDIDAGHVWAAPLLADETLAGHSLPDEAWPDEASPRDETPRGLGMHLGPATLVHDAGPLLGAATPVVDGGLLLARTRHLEHVDAAGRVVGRLELIPAGVASRLNDAAADPAGRSLVGSMAMDHRTGGERLWRLEDDGALTVLDDDLTLSNGLGWSPDGSLLYTVDSIPGTLYVRDYDPVTGRVGRRHVLLEVRDATPDGLTVDADGNIWLALWGGGAVRCLAPDGRVLDEVRTGAPLTTSCAFVGPDLDVLVVTSAGREESGVTQTEVAGRLLGLRPGVVGRSTTPWRPVPLVSP